MTAFRRAALAFTTALTACASSSSSAPIQDARAGTASVTRVSGVAGTAELRQVNNGIASAERTIAAPSEKVFTLLPAVYDALGIPVNTVVSDRRTFGVRAGQVRRRLGKTSLSRYLSCGVDAMNAPTADAYMVTLTVLSRVTSVSATTSTLVTQVDASARPTTVSGNTVNCGSTGQLEQAVNAAAEAAAR